ncbi:hypothetical protein BDZ97DRAFT_1668082 [Flammula alnicola]|nr:hypothetical protein BDZ97DRAFT_1668082 [Flammula alnicola]
MRVGISHGGGQKHPKVLKQTADNKPILDGLLKNKAFERISGFTSRAFSEVAPRLYDYHNSQLSKLIDEDQRRRAANTHEHPWEEELRRNFPNTPWAATSFNFGPQTVCYRHADFNNLAFGWCCITALGQFDPTKGGHLVLWDLGIVIEFPPGTSILIPSAVISHSNVPIGSHETRYSFTQYSAGGIFRWNDNEFKTVADFKKGFSDEEWAAVKKELSEQLDFGLALYTTFPELKRMKPEVAEAADDSL